MLTPTEDEMEQHRLNDFDNVSKRPKHAVIRKSDSITQCSRSLYSTKYTCLTPRYGFSDITF